MLGTEKLGREKSRWIERLPETEKLESETQVDRERETEKTEERETQED